MTLDVVVIGAGVFGLNIALAARTAGLKTMLVDPDPARGASGGLVGALSAHMPLRWNEKKAFQLAALTDMPAHIAQLEDKTGIDCGYKRNGRLIPIPDGEARSRMQLWRAAARENWPDGVRYHILKAPPDPDWLAPESCAAGVLLEGLAGQINPRAYLAALRAAFGESEIRPDRLVQIGDGGAHLESGLVRAGTTVLAMGYQLFSFVQAHFGLALGRGVKGQSALMDVRMPNDTPTIYAGGLYIIPHAHGVAIGSTSENGWSDAASTDRQLEALIARARTVSPRLRRAGIIERWAGIRPRANSREPVLGFLPEHPGVLIAGGGFKIGFGVAHRLARSALHLIETGAAPELPRRFTLQEVLARG